MMEKISVTVYRPTARDVERLTSVMSDGSDSVERMSVDSPEIGELSVVLTRMPF